MAFYSSGIFYGSGAKYVGAVTTAAQGIPIDLRFYRTSQDGIYVFWWGFDPAFITPALASAGFDLQLDTTPLFNSPNLVTWTQLTAVTFQNGNVRKGFAVPVAARIDGVVQTWYAQVRTHTPSFVSAWSAPLTWTIPVSVQQSSAEALMESLSDYHVYGKGDLLKPLSQRNTNLWQVEYMYGNQLDQVFYANFLTQTDNYVDMCVDENLAENFGVMFNFPKPISMQYVDYRWILMNLYLASLVGGTNEAVILTVQAFTGVPPVITNISDLNNFILTTTQDGPITQTLRTTVIISVIDGTHLEVGSTIGWVVGSALDTTASVPFTITEVEDSTHLIVNNTAGMSNGDTIVESIFYTSSPFIDNTLVVQDVSPISPVSPLASASTYAVIASSTITNTGTTTLTGNVALSPAGSITGSPTVIGTTHNGDAAAAQALSDAHTAYTAFAALTGATVLTGDLGGRVLPPGLYKYSSSAGLTGTLTLDAGGNPGAQWIFQIGSTLTTASSSSVVIINGGTAGNVYWQVGSSATLGTSTAFQGTIIALASVSATTNVTVQGRLFALTAAVTLDTNTVTVVSGSSSSSAGLLVPSSAYTTNGALGYWTMLIPTTDTLQATFDTGNPIKIFNALQGATILTGFATFTNGSTLVTGSGTLFLSQLMTGQEITDPVGVYLGTVQSINSDTSLTLVEPWVGPTEVVTVYVLQYTDTQLPVPVLWDAATLASGVLITINNPGEFVLS